MPDRFLSAAADWFAREFPVVSPAMRTIRVVYLARAINGVAPFERFLQSYRQFPAGIEHNFAVVLKGFRSDFDLEPYNKLVAALGAESMRVADYGFDLRAY